MSPFNISIEHFIGGFSQYSMARKTNKRHVGVMEEIKLSLFSEVNIIYLENLIYSQL